MTALRDVARFAALYPEAAGLIRHNLPGHAMFELDALADLAGRLEAVLIPTRFLPTSYRLPRRSAVSKIMDHDWFLNLSNATPLIVLCLR